MERVRNLLVHTANYYGAGGLERGGQGQSCYDFVSLGANENLRP